MQPARPVLHAPALHSPSLLIHLDANDGRSHHPAAACSMVASSTLIPFPQTPRCWTAARLSAPCCRCPSMDHSLTCACVQVILFPAAAVAQGLGRRGCLPYWLPIASRCQPLASISVSSLSLSIPLIHASSSAPPDLTCTCVQVLVLPAATMAQGLGRRGCLSYWLVHCLPVASRCHPLACILALSRGRQYHSATCPFHSLPDSSESLSDSGTIVVQRRKKGRGTALAA